MIQLFIIVNLTVKDKYVGSFDLAIKGQWQGNVIIKTIKVYWINN